MEQRYRLHQGSRSSHQQIAALLRELNVSPVLDVGAAQGIIGRVMQSSGIEIDAVEPSAEWAEAAKPFYRDVFPCTIESASLRAAQYRAIVCGDVLEHLAHPLAVLHQLREVAAPGAAFIISVPNVAHLAVRLLLLAGKFPKMKRGILDRTHLQFFTRDTAADLIRDAGLTIERVSATPVPLDGDPTSRSRRFLIGPAMGMQLAAVRLLPRLFAMQWIFLARG